LFWSEDIFFWATTRKTLPVYKNGELNTLFSYSGSKREEWADLRAASERVTREERAVQP
jgi:hypothetical protein